MAKSIDVTVKLFAAYQEACGVPELRLSLPSQSRAIAVLDYVLRRHPELERWRSLTRLGINCQFAEFDALLHEGDEVVLIPPVSGG